MHSLGKRADPLKVSGVRISPSPKADSPSLRAGIVDVALIVAVTLLVRAATFWSQVIDWDVGLYLVVAREVLLGHLPYVTAWEFRPPGLFFLLAGALRVFGNPGTAMAVLGVTGVTATSLALYALGRAFGNGGRMIGVVAGLLYATISIEDDGLATNTEILFAPFVCWAIYLVVGAVARGRSLSLGRAAGIGLLLGGALQMKLMVVPEAAFVIALAAWWARGGIGSGAVAAAIALLPFGVEAALYAARGQLGTFLDANFYAGLRRAGVGTTAPRDNLQRILAQPVALFPASVLWLLAPFGFVREEVRSPRRALIAVIAAWLVVEALTIVLVREYNDHQFLQLLPPLAVLAAYGTVSVGALAGMPRVFATVAVLLSFGLHGYYQVASTVRLAYHRSVLHDSTYREANVDRIARALRMYPPGDRSVFVVGETPIIYVLADAPLPTRYPFSLYLTDPEMWPLTGVDGRTEVARILATQPRFIVRSDSQFHLDPAVDAKVRAALAQRYRLEQQFEHDSLYERR
jgi:4-amino-4-deoxy-L-arabinose transferase-like glycosyltransferase